MKDVEGEAEQQPFSSNLRVAPKQKTPEIKILLHIRKVAFGLNGAVHPKQAALRRGDLFFHTSYVFCREPAVLDFRAVGSGGEADRLFGVRALRVPVAGDQLLGVSLQERQRPPDAILAVELGQQDVVYLKLGQVYGNTARANEELLYGE